MDDTIFEAALIQVITRLSELAEEKKQLDRRRAEIEQEMAIARAKAIALNDLIYEEPPADSPMGELLKQLEGMGLTDACREVLKASMKAMTPVEVRDALIKMGYDIKKYKNILASIHTILKRLSNTSNVWVCVRDKDKKVAYKWGGIEEVPAQESDKVKPFRKKASKR